MQRFWIAIPCVITSVILLSFCLVDQSAARERNVAGWCNRQCKAAYGLRAPATRGWGARSEMWILWLFCMSLDYSWGLV